MKRSSLFAVLFVLLKSMDLAIEYEVIDGLKCMTSADLETDTALATWQGDEVDAMLLKWVKEFNEER